MCRACVKPPRLWRAITTQVPREAWDQVHDAIVDPGTQRSSSTARLADLPASAAVLASLSRGMRFQTPGARAGWFVDREWSSDRRVDTAAAHGPAQDSERVLPSDTPGRHAAGFSRAAWPRRRTAGTRRRRGGGASGPFQRP